MSRWKRLTYEDLAPPVDWPELWRKTCRPRLMMRKAPVGSEKNYDWRCAVCDESKTRGWGARNPGLFGVWRRHHNTHCSAGAVSDFVIVELRGKVTDNELSIAADLIADEVRCSGCGAIEVVRDLLLEQQMIANPRRVIR